MRGEEHHVYGRRGQAAGVGWWWIGGRWPLVLLALLPLLYVFSHTYFAEQQPCGPPESIAPPTTTTASQASTPSTSSTKQLAGLQIPHYSLVPLYKLEVEPLLQEHMFRSPSHSMGPPDPLVMAWDDSVLEDRGHLKMLPHSLYKFVCNLNTPHHDHLDCHKTAPLREVVDAVLPSRRIMMDVGGNRFATSVGWFKRNYPVEFTRIFVWETVPDFFYVPDAPTAAAEFNLSMAEATRWVESITFYNEYVHAKPDGSNADLAHILLTNVKSEDYCAVKIDIEGGEWDLLPHLEQTGAMELIDELFVEFHFHHDMLAAYGWTAQKFPHTIEETVEAMEKLRQRPNMIFHYWP